MIQRPVRYANGARNLVTVFMLVPGSRALHNAFPNKKRALVDALFVKLLSAKLEGG
jgi:hypothetical protein